MTSGSHSSVVSSLSEERNSFTRSSSNVWKISRKIREPGRNIWRNFCFGVEVKKCQVCELKSWEVIQKSNFGDFSSIIGLEKFCQTFPEILIWCPLHTLNFVGQNFKVNTTHILNTWNDNTQFASNYPLCHFMCLTPTNGRLILPQPNWGLVTQECHILPPLKKISPRDLVE